MTKTWKKRIQHKFFPLFWSKIAIYLYIRIWIQRPHWIRIQSGSGSAALQVTEDIENEQGHKSNILDNWGITWNNLLFSKKDYSKFIAILVGFVPLKSCDFLGSRNKKNHLPRTWHRFPSIRFLIINADPDHINVESGSETLVKSAVFPPKPKNRNFDATVRRTVSNLPYCCTHPDSWGQRKWL